MRLLRNPHVLDHPETDGASAPAHPGGLRHPTDLHRLIDGYRPTPLVDLPALAERLGVGRVLAKYEAERFGLPAFKILGASWATYLALAERYRAQFGEAPPTATFDELRAALARLGALTLTTATDGNHGRGVARMAAWLGFDADIYMPAGTVDARVEAIESEGATVTVIDGDYDEAVATAAATADDDADRVVISDTSWPGYVDVPTWIAEGYATIFGEIDDQLAAADLGPLDAYVVPVGVGAFAKAALDHWPAGPPDGPLRIAVEPLAADCLYRSIAAGEPTVAPGPHDSIMAGMNCGTVSMIAWPVMRDRVDWCVAIEDDYAAEAMRALAAEGLVVGETGAAALGALLALLAEAPDGLAAVGLDASSTVLCLCTEGATDPVNYERIVGSAPDAIAAR